MTNILQLFYNLAKNQQIEIREFSESTNRANQMGEGFEEFIKDLFCDSFAKNSQEKLEIFSKNFSWSGNNSNPPDLMIRSGDAVEMKKIESATSGLALNSSHPKNKLFVDDPKINKAIREAEIWREKDIIYAIGYIPKNTKILREIWFVYGDCYAASREVYDNLANRISNAAKMTENVEFSDSKELAHVNRVDPLGITYLRVRGMWGIEHPAKAFDYLPRIRENFANLIMRREKYDSFDEVFREKLEKIQNENFQILDVRIKNPDNPAQLLDAKLLRIRRKNE